MKAQVTTLDGKPVTRRHLTERVGASLWIAPAFLAAVTDESTGVETSLKAHYDRAKGRYIVTSVTNRAVRDAFEIEDLRRVSIAPILQAAVPYCVAFDMEGEMSDVIVGDLATGERLMPPWLVDAVTRRGAGDERLDAIEIIYGAAALAGLPPVKAVQRELGVPHRTASDWIKRARAAGRLEGITYAIGRQADE